MEKEQFFKHGIKEKCCEKRVYMTDKDSYLYSDWTHLFSTFKVHTKPKK